jgi:hypothetical protein
MRAKVTFYDEKTGRVIEETDKAVFIGNKAYVDRGFTKFFVAFLSDILEDPEYGKGPIRLLLYIASRLNYDTLEVAIFPEKVAKELGITRQAVYNWLNVLLRKGTLEKKDIHLYRLKPYTVVKGNAKKANENAIISDFDPHKFDDYMP